MRLLAIATTVLLIVAVADAQQRRRIRMGGMQLNFEDIRATSIKVGFRFTQGAKRYYVAAKEWINNKYEQTVATSEKYVSEHQRNARLTGLLSGRDYLIQVQALNSLNRSIGSMSEKVAKTLLRCYVCDGRPSNRACNRNAIRNCPVGTDACLNEMRYHNGRLAITKRCAQFRPELAKKIRGGKDVTKACGGVHAKDAVCKCMCKSDVCNAADLPCSDRCNAKLAYPKGGGFRCTNNNRVNSVCTWFCPYGTTMNGWKDTTCRTDRTWSNRTPPRCVKPKPTPVGNPNGEVVDGVYKEYICPVLNPPANGKISCSFGRTRGSVCTSSCNVGYNPVSPALTQRQCSADGRWTNRQTVCKIVTCPTPPISRRLVMDCDKKYTIGSTCEISCPENLSLTGVNRVECGATGKWSAPLPICEKRGCQAFPRVGANVLEECHEVTVPSEGAECAYSCKPGFAMRGEATSTCTNNVWSNNAPTCQSIRCSPPMNQPAFGIVRCSLSNRYKSKCTFRCNNNYNLIGSSSVTCGATGQWSSEAPTCERITCAPISNFNRGSYSCNRGRDINSVCSFRCNSGYGLGIGSTSRITCKAPSKIDRSREFQGRWSGKIPTCEVIRCSPLKLDDNVSRVCTKTDYRSLGSVCRFRCGSGYQIAGRSAATCNLGTSGRALGRWSNIPPKCVRRQCKRLGLLRHGEITCTDALYAGSVCTAQCDHGYEVIGNPNVNCNNDGRWNRRLPICKLVICKAPARPTQEHFVYECGKSLRDPRFNNFFVDFECPLSCSAGFTITGGASATCGVKGEWVTSQKIVCEDYNECNVSNGGCDQSCTNSYGSFECSCDENHRLLPDGKTCKLIVCPDLKPDPQRTLVCTDGYSIGSICMITCQPGYEPRGGASALTCSEDGSWDQTQATCQRVFCPSLRAPFNGELMCGDANRYESLCVSTCNEGYEMIGEDITTCTHDKTWTNDVPKCRKIQCPANQTSLQNGRAVCSEANFFQSVCRYFCNPGYKYVGIPANAFALPTSTCGSDAAWSFEAPSCEKVACDPTVEIMDAQRPNGEVACTEDNLFESTCSITCPTGYELIGPARTTCNHNRAWTQILGHCERVKCAARDPPRDGSIECTEGNLFGSVCVVRCDVGHDMIGQRTSRCQADRTWSERAPTCQRVTCDEARMAIGHGEVTCSDESFYDSRCAASCNLGYEFDTNTVLEFTRKARIARLMNATKGGAGNSITSRCMASSQWDISAPTCVKHSCVPTAEFLNVTRPNGEVTCTDGELFQSLCTLACDVGYELVDGEETTECGNRRQWLEQLGVCQRVQCPGFSNFRNGVLRCDNHFSYESVCKFTCVPGYDLVGEATSTCQADRTFSNPQPHCEKIECPSSHMNLENGRATCSDGSRFESECVYVCDPGYEMTSSPDADTEYSADVVVMTCHADRTWSGELPYCKRKQCSQHDGALTKAKLNGDVVCSESAWFGSQCSVTCHSGYRLIGPDTTRCTASADWAPTLGYCEKIECGPLTAPSNSEMECSDSFRFESTCSVTCNYGYELIGASDVTCQADKTYSGDLPTCKEIICPMSFTALENGQAICSNTNKFDSVCTYQCNPGYEMTSESVAKATCQVTYSWDATDEPMCVKKICSHADPVLKRALQQGTITCTDEDRFESECSLTCNEGHELTGGIGKTTCLANQNWDNNFGFCQKIRCPAFTALENGQITCDDANRYLSVCSFGCDAGYELIGDSSSTCQADRTFTVELPSCNKTECPSSHLSIDNGATTCTESNLFESVCEYVCDAGYEINAGSARAQCQDDQSWDKAKATCEKKLCANDNEDFTRADRHGVITCTEGHVFDSQCSLECDAGYRLTDGASGQTRCNEEAEWEPTLGYCIKIECEAYGTLTNGGIDCSEQNLFLSICEFQCDAGYEMEGSASSVCQANKSWTAPMPECYKISCPRSYLELDNGVTECTETNRFGSVCSYTCESGYEMASTDVNSTLCTETKTWTYSKPTCSKKKCPRNDPSLLKADMIGNVTCTDENRYQSTCTVTCPAGYELIGGVNSVTCLASATWNAEIGACQRIHCVALERPANSDLSCSNSYRFESVCEFECDVGYVLVGDPSTTCQADRTFSNEVPHCNKITCAIDYMSIDYGTVICSEENLFESVCAYQCDVGYRFFNNDAIADDVMTATCLADSSWTNEVPICEKVTCNHDDEDFVEAHETGNVTCTEGNRFGSTCTVTCDEGSNVIGQEATTCTNTGMWNASLGHCKTVQCDQLTEPFFGNLTCSKGFGFDSRCEYRCQEGYEFTSESWDMVITEQNSAEESQTTISALCKADGTWTISGSPECERKACPIDGWNSMENGFVACSDSNLYLSQCLFQCNPGYEAMTPQDQHDVTSVLVTCTSAGQWSVEQPPVCIRLQCQQNETELQKLEPHGRVTCTNGAFYDSECTVKCNKGYHLASDFNTTRCDNNREWSLMLATCEKNRCQPLSDPANGMLTCTDEHFFKSHCYLKCEAGYQIVDPEDEYDVTGGLTCRSDGTWCGDVPRCEKIQCPKEQTDIINGDVVCSDFNFYESQCAYACDLGYHMIQGQSSVAECLATGQWSERAPLCQNKRCPANETSLLEAQERGDVTCASENQFGSRCMLKCYDGYQMTGEPTTSCMHTGEWSNGLGLCQRISCNAMEANDHSTLECTDQFRYQSVCLTACEAGYERVTSSDSMGDVTYDVKCGADGQWVGTLPECQKKTCKWPGYSSLANGHVQCTEQNSYGSGCIYICLPGYEMQHSAGVDTTVAIANCTVNGTWNIYPPMCVPSQCSPTVRQMKESVANGNVTCTNGSAFGSKCAVKCECGYQRSSEGSVETECQRNGNWWPPMAGCEKIKCPAPEVPAHTQIRCTNEYSFDSTCSSASCDDGYMLTSEDDDIITCAGEGHWLGVLPPCKKRECSASFLDLENGSMICSDSNNFASTCEYSCDPGFVLAAPRQTAQCLASGEWSVEAVVCTRRTSCQSTYFAFGSVECARDGRCQLSCDVGTDLIGLGESTCRDDTPGPIQWEPELGVCKKRSCGSLSAPIDGSITCSDHMRFRSSCRFRCNEGYGLIGEITLKCGASGSWSGEVPQCVVRTCNPSYLTIENGLVVTSNSVNNGSIAAVTCATGFELIGSSEITCLSGAWNKAKPSCQRLTCPPLNLDNGKVECGQDSTQEHGVKCNFTCNSMYELIGNVSATCRSDGSWSNPTPYCKGYCDPSFTSSPSGRVNCSNSHYHRSQCRFWCDSDSDVTTQLYGSSLVTCQEDGRWSETPPCCARECPEHAKMDLYFVLDSSSTEGFQNWTKVLEFVNMFLSQLSIGQQDTLVGVVRYNRDVDVKGELPLGKFQTLSELQHAVTFMPYGGWGTNTGRALTYVAENSFASPSNRPDAHDYVILITDDVSDDDVTQAAQTLTQNMITAFTVGIGDVDSNQLRTIASKPEYAHSVGENFEGLNQELANSITSSLCDNPCLMQNSWRNIASDYLNSSEG